MKTKLSIVTLLILVLGVMASAVSAQGGPGDPGRPGDRPGGRGDRADRPQPIRNAMETIAGELGLTEQELVELVRDAEEGTTLADIISANGGDVNAIIGVLIANATEEINEAVTDGRLTQDRADELLANLETRVTDLLNREKQDRPAGDRPGRGGRGALELGRIIGDWIETNTDLTGAEIREAIRDGATFAEVLTDAGVELDAFVADVTAEVEAKLAEAVAEGDLTQDEADEMLERFLEGLNNRLFPPANV